MSNTLISNPNSLSIGVISDTHGLIRPEVISVFQDVNQIIHAGDIDNFECMYSLQKLADVIAVRGNMDKGAWSKPLKTAELVTLLGYNMYILHDVGWLDLQPEIADLHVVISGHTHQPEVIEKNNVLFLNPGSAGPQRKGLPIALARMEMTYECIQVQIYHLNDKKGEFEPVSYSTYSSSKKIV
ncbi:MAG: metallophosphoesterase family protein [Desulfobacterales bacterium]|nr:metallophosphoesterase family protein [Desulfobacterales bacterium]